MAQAKSRNRKSNSKSQHKSASAKRSVGGWEDVTGGFGVRWEPKKKGETLEGICTSIRTDLKPLKKGGEKGAVMEISAEDGHSHSVFRSAALRALFAKAGVGDHIRLVYEGALQLKKGQQPFKQIRAFLKSAS